MLVDECRRLLAAPPPQGNADYPFLLFSRRHRESMNSWMNDNTQLFRHQRGNQAEMHVEDLRMLKLEDGDRVRVVSAVGAIETTVTASAGGRRGIVTIPHGWGSRVFDTRAPGQARSWGVNRNLLVDNQRIDPLSQTPLLNMAQVRIEPVQATAGLTPGTGVRAEPMRVAS